MKTSTSWGTVADWYDDYLKDEDSYQRVVILPNLLRILEPVRGKKILDIACGQGFFSHEIAAKGGDVTGLDISPELIEKAKKPKTKAHFLVSTASDLSLIKIASIDIAICILAAQNIRELDKMFAECSRVLKKGGKLVLVLNHPSFRIPQSSDWHFDETKKKQGRLVYKYMSETTVKIDMNPSVSKVHTDSKIWTVSYHRPLQVFIKWLSKNGFAVTKLEEWISHKKSQPGPKAAALDESRKEIPMFMCLEATLF